MVNLYELFNVHVNKANENTNSPMVTLRIIKGTIFYATAAFLMAPSVRSTKEVWSLTDSVIVMFTLSVDWNFIAYWLSLMSDWSTGTSHIICYVNEIMIALKILIIALNCWITDYWEHEHWDLICIFCMCIYKNDFFLNMHKKLPAPVTRRNRYMFQIHRQMNHLN